MVDGADPDRELVESAQKGDQAAFEQLVKKYQQKIFNYCYYWSPGLRPEAFDNSQEIFLRAYRSLRTFRGAAPFKTWLYAIAKNFCLSRTSGSKRMVPTKSFSALEHEFAKEQGKGLRAEEILPHPDPGPDHEERILMRDLVAKCLDKLDQTRCRMVVLYYFNGHSYKEIAEIVELPLGTVRSNLHRAVKMDLRECIEDLGLWDDDHRQDRRP
jgi:RNA polymerase sigma-70 factor, ECF subfamily